MAAIPRVRGSTYSQNVFNGSRTELKTITGYKSESEAQSSAIAVSMSWDEGNPTTPRMTGKSMTDFLVPGYHRIKRTGGLLPVNPCSSIDHGEIAKFQAMCILRSITTSGSGASQRWSVTDRKVVWTICPNVVPTLPSGNANALLNEAYSRLKAGFMDVLTSASEFHKTVSLVTGFRRRCKDTILNLVREFGSTKKGKTIRTFSQGLKAFSSFWLEARYGWRILIFEYNSIARYVNSKESGICRKAFRSSGSLPDSEIVIEATSPGYAIIAAKTTISRTAKIRAGVVGKVNMSAPGKLDPLTTAWELIPLSFVIDMFWNVGSVISAQSPFSGVDVEASWVSREGTASVNIEFTPIPGGNEVKFFQVRSSGNPMKRIYSRVSQEPNFGISPVINLNLPKLVDLGSLTVVLYGAIKGLVRRNGG